MGEGSAGSATAAGLVAAVRPEQWPAGRAGSTAAQMRRLGFGRTLRPGVPAPADWLDGWDRAANAHVAMVCAASGGPILTSMRLLDSRTGALELAAHIDLAADLASLGPAAP